MDQMQKQFFLDMLTEMNLTDVHLQFNAHTPLDTWSNKSHKSRIDYIFVNEGLLGSIDLHEVLNIERRQALVKNKLENEEWSMIAEKVEEKMKQGTIFNDASIEENDLIWERLKSDIVAEIDHVIKEKKSKEICDWKKRSGRKPIETIDESIYSSLCDEVTDKELVETLKTVKNDKAAGASGIIRLLEKG
ncbi:hypothetical protein RhiirC2_870805 [Rhizophagus irregularis]|uniref:Uncharacterized protein n=1 Tax=Rhizophagus irregularis TaxID=588596 RepID=A0A2N1MGR8_9GLOM|nr:hypothetical protein RhiirC2_870805 [Rhizophagus irregularis]